MKNLTSRWTLPETDLRDALLAAYAEPHRGYHNQIHLDEVFERLYELGASRIFWEMLPVTLAAWFHDAIYDGQPNAEARSAEWARASLTESGVDTGTVTEVVRLVLLTANHAPAADDVNGAALCDSDLAILASGIERYTSYAAGVREECSHLDDSAFIAGRSQVIAQLLNKESIFTTAPARALWEAPARRNLADELASLENMTSSVSGSTGKRRAAPGKRAATS